MNGRQPVFRNTLTNWQRRCTNDRSKYVYSIIIIIKNRHFPVFYLRHSNDDRYIYLATKVKYYEQLVTTRQTSMFPC